MTKPIENILPRNVDPKFQETLDFFANGLDEIVNFGTHMLKWDLERKSGGDYILPASLFFRNFIEKIDAISILVRNCAIDSSKSPLRTALENFFYLEYLLQKDTYQRSMSFLVWDTIQQLKLLGKFNPKTAQGKELIAKLRNDKLLSNYKPTEIKNWQELKDEKNDLLNSDEYKSVKNEYYNTERKLKPKKPNWYSLYDGPKNLAELAKEVGYLGLYETYYRIYSKSIHGNDILQGRIASSKTGQPEIFQIRFPGDAQFITHETFSITLIAFSTFCKVRLADKLEQFNAWSEVMQETYKKIGRININIK